MDIGELDCSYVYCNECKGSVVNACMVDIGEHLIAHYWYWNESKDSVVNIHEHCIAIDMKLRGGVSNISLANIRTWSFDHQGHAVSGKLAGGKKCSEQGMF